MSRDRADDALTADRTNLGPWPALEADRLILRPFSRGDWEAIDAVLSDPEVTRYMHFASWDRGRRRGWFDRCVARGLRPDTDTHERAIVLKDTGGVIGWFGIGPAVRPAAERERDFGLALDRRCWGRGYMTEALRAVLAHEFEVLGTRRVFATCEVPNGASARVMEKAGMRYRGTFHGPDFEGNRADCRHYAIHAHEFRA